MPVEAAKEILLPEVGALLPLCTTLPVTLGGSLELPADLRSPYSETGIIAGWQIEGDQVVQRKPNLDLLTFNLKKLIALVPCSDELLEDSDALAAYLPLALQTAVTRRVNEAIISGPGAGRPLGILNSSATISVAKDGSQGAGTVVDANIAAMLARALTPDRGVWLANPALYGQLVNLFAWNGTSRTLAGLPIVLTDACPAPGTRGDFILADMSGYLVAQKTPGLNLSSHLWFDQDVSAYRFTYRCDGMPLLAVPVTPPNATATKSHFVTVADRT